MDRSITQALTGLVPTISGPLPKELVELAISLLAQSRNKASSLKAEEEIARLKLSLGLPKIEPRPPCPPRIYHKLYKYLDSVLTAGTRRSARPARAPTAGSTPTSSPAKPRAPARSTPLKPTTPHKKAKSQVTLASDAPKWVMPTIRHLCRALGAPAAPHHVYAGVSSILTLPAPRVDAATTTDEPGVLDISALIIVVYLLVVTRLTGNEMPAREFTRLRGLAIASIKDSKITEAAEEVADSDHVILSVGGWMKDIGVKGWTELDWFANVGEGTGLGMAEAVSDDEENDSENEKAGRRGTNFITERVDLNCDDEDLSILKPGLGTMMQDRVDYLSESNLREYQAWKKDILLRCDEIENARRMEVSAD